MEAQILVLFGITGDLAKRKILPALKELHEQALLNAGTCIIGVGRSEYTTETIRAHIAEITGGNEQFTQRFSYIRGSLNEDTTYEALSNTIAEISQEKNTHATAFYYSIPPRFFADVTEQLAKHDLASKEGNYKIAFEKPFGHDLKSAQELNNILTSTFCEEQIYRIDHYLAKSAVDNILTFRFANTVFDSVLHKECVDSIEVLAAETLGVEGRAGYYEGAGALRDMVQNHLMQILSLILAHRPESFESHAIHDAKAKAISQLRVQQIVRGQYEHGNGMKAYRDEEGVDKNSNTETYVAIELASSDENWQGVPINIISGKRLQKKLTQVTVRFKKPLMEGAEANELRIEIQPEEIIAITLNTHTPRPKRALVQQNMEYCHDCVYGTTIPEAYQTVLLELFEGNKTIFSSWKEVEESWKLLDPILAEPEQLYMYEAGSWGPAGEDTQ